MRFLFGFSKNGMLAPFAFQFAFERCAVIEAVKA